MCHLNYALNVGSCYVFIAADSRRSCVWEQHSRSIYIDRVDVIEGKLSQIALARAKKIQIQQTLANI